MESFFEGAQVLVDFSFETYGARLETRLAAQDGSGDGALKQTGAIQSPVSRKYRDQVLWSILDSEWRQAKAVWGPKVH